MNKIIEDIRFGRDLILETIFNLIYLVFYIVLSPIIFPCWVVGGLSRAIRERTVEEVPITKCKYSDGELADSNNNEAQNRLIDRGEALGLDVDEYFSWVELDKAIVAKTMKAEK